MMLMGVIPFEGKFEITQEIIDCFYELYPFPVTRKNNLKPSAVKYAKKLAALSLTKLLNSRTEILSNGRTVKLKSNSGFLYIVTNPAFPGYFKIGITSRPKVRLKQYQIYDPHKKYVMKHSKFYEEVRHIEKEILEKFSLDLHSGEWITRRVYLEILDTYFQIKPSSSKERKFFQKI